MSWQLASFVIVGAALAVWAWWYEHSRPSAKLVAVVGTLTALAALGRDAFAAVPDVKPITAIVLVSGIAFGAGPGLAVGAVSALASNVLLGEGPWTPWQMLGWGLVGLLGGVLGGLGWRRAPTLAIALACALAAEAFNLVVDLYTWTGTGDHSLSAFGAVLGLALPFDLTHVIASFGFGLLFGGVLLRMLLRIRARLEVHWVPEGAAPAADAAPIPSGAGQVTRVAGLLVVALCCAGVGLSAASPTRASARGAAPAAAGASSGVASYIARGVSYLASAQDSDGGWGAAPGQPASELYSSWSAIGLAAGGRSPSSLRRGGHEVLGALRAQAHTLEGAGDLERTILALRACGASTSSFPGGDPVTRLLRYRSRDGSFEGLTNLTAFAVLALRAAGYTPGSADVRTAATWLQRQQEKDGGFGYAGRLPGGGGADVDDTGAVLEALAAAGIRSGAVIAHAVSYLRSAQNGDGGFPQQRGGRSNAQSSAWGAQGLDATGLGAASLQRRGHSPISYLESLMGKAGSVRYSAESSQTPVWVTAEVLPALAGRPLPVYGGAARALAAGNAAAGALADRSQRSSLP